MANSYSKEYIDNLVEKIRKSENDENDLAEFCKIAGVEKEYYNACAWDEVNQILSKAASILNVDIEDYDFERFEYIQDALNSHNESGIVVYPSNEAIICNWGYSKGLPRLLCVGIIMNVIDTIDVIRRDNIKSWRDYINSCGCDIIFDMNDDMELANDCEAELIELVTGTVIIAPVEWH